MSVVHTTEGISEDSPVRSLHVALTRSSRRTGHFHGDAVIGLKAIVEVAVAGVRSFVKEDFYGPFLRLQLGSGSGGGDHAGEEYLREEEQCETQLCSFRCIKQDSAPAGDEAGKIPANLRSYQL